MARMSIYLPDDLKAKMDDVEAVNWSGIAQGAFESELRYHPKLTENRMSALVERLRRSKEEFNGTAEEQGFNAGRHWAETRATYAELKSIAEKFDENTEDPDEFAFRSLPSILPGGWDENETFWEDIASPGVELSSPYMFGFARGAVSVWEEVSDEL
jgi:hypothetical protein